MNKITSTEQKLKGNRKMTKVILNKIAFVCVGILIGVSATVMYFELNGRRVTHQMISATSSKPTDAEIWNIQIKNISRDLPMLQGLSREPVDENTVLEFFGNRYVGLMPNVMANSKAEKSENENHRLAMDMIKLEDGKLYSQVAGVINIQSTDTGYLIEVPKCAAYVCKTPKIFVKRIH